MKIYERFSDAEMKRLGLTGNMPKHVGIIMDGNGRWAKSRMLPRSLGHRAGMDALQEIVRVSKSIGIEALTVYAFSTENWLRPEQEVNALFSLLVEYFYKEIDELDANNVRVHILGSLERFSPKLRELMENARERTGKNTGLHFAIALNYGSRDEITRAVRSIVSEGIPESEITEETISSHLYTSCLPHPDPDVIIRTAGEQRLSNFLLWQAAYSEFVFTDTTFPDFTPEVYFECIKQYMHRTRRFGRVLEV